MTPTPTLVQRVARGVRTLAATTTGGPPAARHALAAAVVDSTAEAICAFDPFMRIIEWNPAMAELTGMPSDQAIGRFGHTLEVTGDWTAPGGVWYRALGGTATRLHEEPWGRRHGHEGIYLEGTIAPLLGEGGTVLGGVMTLRDVSERVRGAELLRDSENRFRSLFDQAEVGIVVLDHAEVIRDVNPAFVQLVGYSSSELIGRHSSELAMPEDVELTRESVREVFAGRRRSATMERRFVRKDGVVRWATFTVSRIKAFGAELSVVGMAHDITQRKELENELIHQASHDPLTGLGNRALFRDRVERALEQAGHSRDRIAVVFCDLDDFKKVNDSLGHAAGDQLLQIVAERLLNATRGADTVARLGGDEFAILVRNAASPDDVLIVADRVVQALRRPVTLDGKDVFVGGSVGIARAAPEDDAATLLRNADVAMYTAKHDGKGRRAVFERGMHSVAIERLELEAGVRRALDRDELRLLYQPVVELDGGRVVGAEALLRWEHPERGLLSPCAFLRMCEETGLIVPVGLWALREACRVGARWDASLREDRPADAAPDDAAPFTLSVNVSARQLQDQGFVADVATALADSGMPAAALLLEITESVFVQHDDAVLERLRALKALGVRLGIDDFGTGFSSLSYLRRFPIDVLKIDKSFVDGVAHDGGDAALARAVIALGEVLSLRTIAEGVARPQQQERLRGLGCELGQGFLFAEPIAASEVERMLMDGARG